MLPRDRDGRAWVVRIKWSHGQSRRGVGQSSAFFRVVLTVGQDMRDRYRVPAGPIGGMVLFFVLTATRRRDSAAVGIRVHTRLAGKVAVCTRRSAIASPLAFMTRVAGLGKPFAFPSRRNSSSTGHIQTGSWTSAAVVVGNSRSEAACVGILWNVGASSLEYRRPRHTRGRWRWGSGACSSRVI